MNNSTTNSEQIAPISLEQARATLWPFRPYKGQSMGSLVDTKQLSLKDLGYAIENAWDERVRQAAITLSLIRMEQAVKEPASSAGPLRVVSGGRSFALRKQFQLRFAQGIVGGIVFGLLVAFLIADISRILSNPITKAQSAALSTPPVIVGAIIFTLLMIGIMLLLQRIFYRFMDWLDRQIDNYRKGEDGEERAVTAIQQGLDGNWYLFRNVVIPGSRGDLDSVLVGPSGVWVLEIKNLTGEFQNLEEAWSYRAGNQWKTAKANPSQQAKKNAGRLGNFLQADNIQHWVIPAVIWANPESSLTVENPMVAVWKLDRLADELSNLRQAKPIPEVIRKQIVDKLTKLCEKQQKAWQEDKD